MKTFVFSVEFWPMAKTSLLPSEAYGVWESGYEDSFRLCTVDLARPREPQGIFLATTARTCVISQLCLCVSHITVFGGEAAHNGSMIEILLIAAASLGLSESIESRLPEDPDMIYTVSFDYHGTKVGLDWKDRAVVPERVCRKVPLVNKSSCQTAALGWLQPECAYYDAKATKNAAHREMEAAVCSGADNLQSMLRGNQFVER